MSDMEIDRYIRIIENAKKLVILMTFNRDIALTMTALFNDIEHILNNPLPTTNERGT